MRRSWASAHPRPELTPSRSITEKTFCLSSAISTEAVWIRVPSWPKLRLRQRKKQRHLQPPCPSLHLLPLRALKTRGTRILTPLIPIVVIHLPVVGAGPLPLRTIITRLLRVPQQHLPTATTVADRHPPIGHLLIQVGSCFLDLSLVVVHI